MTISYKLVKDGVCKTDGALVQYIPSENTDKEEWKQYQAWLADGNTAAPADE